MKNTELTVKEIGELLTIAQIEEKLNRFSEINKKVLPKTVHKKDEYLITLDLVPVKNSLVELPVAFRTKPQTPLDYHKQSWKHFMNDRFWPKGERAKVACAMCDLYFNLSVSQLYDCLKSSLEHARNNKKPPFVVITDRLKDSFDRLPSGTVTVETSEEYKKIKLDLGK